MVYWITDRIGVKAASDELSDKEYGAVIIDCRDLNDGANPVEKLVAKMHGADLVYGLGDRLIFQCQAGMSRSVAMALMLVWVNDFYPGKTIDELYQKIKKKVPTAQINMDLLDSVKQAAQSILHPTKASK